jgi:MFS family permease
MLIFATAASVSALILARIVQGISADAAVGAAGAGMLDISSQRGTLANSVGPMTGTATGAIVSGVLVQYFPAPLHLVYCMFFAIFVMQAVGVALMAESVSLKPGALAALWPQFHLPPAVRAPMLFAIPTLLAATAAYIEKLLMMRNESKISDRHAVIGLIVGERPRRVFGTAGGGSGEPHVAAAASVADPGEIAAVGRGHKIGSKRRAQNLLDGKARRERRCACEQQKNDPRRCSENFRNHC